MKATLGMNYRILSANLENMSNKLYDLRQQAATGKKMNKPSDNPAAIRPVLNYRTLGASTDRYLEHMATAMGEINVLDSNLDQIENVMASAKEVGIAVVNGAVNDQDRITYADRVEQLFEEILQVANTQNNGSYVFSGYLETTPPFIENPGYDPDTYDPNDNSTWAVIYQGDANAKSLEIAPGRKIQAGLTGNDLFLGDADNDGVVDPAGRDLFSVLKNFEHAIRENDSVAINDSIDQLEEGADQVRRLRGRMGNNAWRMERAHQHFTDSSIEFEKIISSYEDADVLEVFSKLVQHETAFEAALNVTTRISRMSILDFM